MQITIHGVEYAFSWQHKNPHTICICKAKMEGTDVTKVLRTGATLSAHDQYCKDVGRKVSLNRMLFTLFPPDAKDLAKTKQMKNYRMLMWDLYFSRLPVVKALSRLGTLSGKGV